MTSRKVPRETRTPYVLLGMLLRGPASGYALRQRIEQSVGNFWQESYGQLYPALAALAESGRIASSVGVQDGRTRRVWHLTEAGRAALSSWLERPPAPQSERNELLLKLFFAELAPAAVRRHVDAARRAAVEEQGKLEQLRAELIERSQGHASLPLWLVTIDYGLAGQQALQRWCEQTLSVLEEMPQTK